MNPDIKIHLTIILFFLTIKVTYSQHHLYTEWEKTRSSSLSGGNAEGWGVDTDPQGNIYWSASFDSTTTTRLYDIITYKFNTSGQKQWESWYGGTGLQHAFVLNAKDTFLYVGGRENTVWPYWSTECNMLLLKINKSDGTLEKNKNIGFGTGGYDEMDAIEMNGSSVYCSGWAQITPGAGNLEMGFLKLSYGLEIQDQKTFGDLTAGSAEHQDGHMVLDNSNIFAGGLWNGHTGIYNISDGRCILGKFDLNWNYLDTVLFGPYLPAPLDLENVLGTTSDGTSIYVTGYSSPVSANNMQIIIAKFDKNLNLKWVTYFGGSGAETARGIVCHDNFVYVCGATNSPGYALAGAYDAVLLRLDTATGTQVDYYTWGDAKDNDFRDLTVYGNKLYLSGTNGTNMFSGGTSDEAFLVSTDLSNLTGMNEISNDYPDVQVFPVPAGDLVYVHTAEKMALVILKNETGQVIIRKEMSANDATVNVAGLPAGFYFMEVITNKINGNRKVIRKIILQ